MTLSEHERTVLRRLDADLDRQDPRLAQQLTEFAPLDDPVQVSWRPPRSAVAVAAVMVAGMVFMLAAVVLLMRPPCRAWSSSAAPAVASSPEQRPGSPASGIDARSAVPGHPRSSSSSQC